MSARDGTGSDGGPDTDRSGFRGERAGATGATGEYEYEEFQLPESTVVMISDPVNRRAWIQSSETVPVRP